MEKISTFIKEVILILAWMLVAFRLKISRTEALSTNIILVPAETHSFIGSRGDEAMMVVATQRLKKQYPGCEVYAACSSNIAIDKANALSLKSFDVWGGKYMPFEFYDALKRIRPSVGVLMGADVMDGFYSPITSLRMIIAADLLARYGAKTFFLGFSLNENPHWVLKYAFRLMSRNVKTNLRDPVSLTRYEMFTGLKANLVADSAFLLVPDTQTTVVKTVRGWVASEKSSGRIVIAINFHPLLFTKQTAQRDVKLLGESLKHVMQTLTAKYQLSWLLLPHDNRPGIGDELCLAQLYEALNAETQPHAFLVKDTPSAAEIKAISGDVSGVITGRMHHAIATLGMGVPVMAYVYQGKFEGLFNHFKLPTWLLFTPVEAQEPAYLEGKMKSFLHNIQQLKDKVIENLPDVEELATKTFN